MEAQDLDRINDSGRLFVVCGRGREEDELKYLFASCGSIKSLHMPVDRSNKTRGFAFIQYHDATSATKAITQFNQLKLKDGFTLKVTLAREKCYPRSNNTKQVYKLTSGEVHSHKRDETHDRYEDELEAIRMPGKRPRSSPSLPSQRNHSFRSAKDKKVNLFQKSPTFIQNIELKYQSKQEGQDVLLNTTSNLVEFGKEVTACESESNNECHLEVQFVMNCVVSTLDKLYASNDTTENSSNDAFSMYKEIQRLQLNNLSQDMKGTEVSTDLLAVGIDSVTLETLKVNRPSENTSSEIQKITSQSSVAQSCDSIDNGNIDSSEHKARRRRKIAESESEESDGHVTTRRKRSNTDQEISNNIVGSFSMTNDPKASLSASSSRYKTKKHCNRRAVHIPQDFSNSEENATRITAIPQVRAAGWTSNELIVSNSNSAQLIPVETKHPRLFFNSIYKFTLQELEAMFCVYHGYECVQLVRSFGRIKTMAYVQYKTMRFAMAVMDSFNEDKTDDYSLTFADEGASSSKLPLQQNQPHPNTKSAANATHSDKCWLLLLYDKSISSEVLSTSVSTCKGMEFVDIKLSKNSGTPKGVAFAKFDDQKNALLAAKQLHRTELPLESGKLLQATVISSPKMFGTREKNSVIANFPQGFEPASAGTAGSDAHTVRNSVNEQLNPDAPDEVDVGAVELRFKRLMRGSDQNNLPYPPNNGDVGNSVSLSQPGENIFRAGNNPSSSVSRFMRDYEPPSPYYNHYQTPHFLPLGYPYITYDGSANSIAPDYSYYYPHAFPYPMDPAYSYGNYPGENTFQSSGAHSLSSTEVSNLEIRHDDPPQQATLSPAHTLYLSSSRPLEFCAVSKVIEKCQGVIAFMKDEPTGQSYAVDFAEAGQAHEAWKQLDGSMCNGQKLRVIKGSDSRDIPSGRKRQRVDPRNLT